MAFTLVTVSGTYHRAPGTTPASGQVVFQLQQTLSQPGEILEPQALSATLDTNGHISLQLVATDDPTTQPQGTTWLVTEEIQGEVPRNYNIAVPHTAGSIDLATVAPVVPGPQNFSYVLTSSVGQPNGVASLDSGGHLPTAQLPTVPVPDIPPLPISQITGLAAELATDEANIASNTSAIAANTTALAGKAAATQLPASNGTDDTAMINSALTAGRYVRGLPGQTYLITAPLVVPSNTALEMTGCTVAFANTSVQTNMVQNAACTPTATATDVTTTSASSVITSAALVAAGAAAGQQVGVVGAGPTGGNGQGPTGRLWLYGTIQSIAGNNITLGGNINGVAASVSLTNATGYLFASRDANVRVIGGTWDAGTNWNVLLTRYNAAYNSNLLRFRRCDRLVVRDVKLAIDVGYKTSGDGWCFGIAPADCTDILIDNCGSAPGKSASTVVNTSGLISRMIVRNIFGTTYDDHVAVGTVGAAFDDIEGDIVDVLIDGVMANGSLRAVDLYCGQGSNGAQRFLTNAEVRSIKGNILTGTGSAAAPIQITNYAGNAQIAAELRDITVFKAGSGGFRVAVPTGQAGIVITGPLAGSDLAVAQITANSTVTGPAIADVGGLSITFGAPPSGQVWLDAWAYSVGQIGSAGNTIVYITDSANNVVAQSFLGNLAAGGFSTSPTPKAKITGLTSGTNYTYKVRMSSSAGTQQVLAGASFPAFLRAAIAS